MPVVKHEPPVVLAEVIGAVTERDLLKVAFADPANLDRPVGEVMEPPLPTDRCGRARRPRREAVGERAGGARPRRRPPDRRRVAGRRARRVGGSEGNAVKPSSSDAGFATRCVHGAGEPDAATGAVVPPINLATTFAQDGVAQHRGFEYSRSGNPTRAALERHVAALEGAAHGFAFASGLAAEDAVLRLLRARRPRRAARRRLRRDDPPGAAGPRRGRPRGVDRRPDRPRRRRRRGRPFDPHGVGRVADEPAPADRRHRRRRHARPWRGALRRRRQHLRHAGAPAAARPRSRHRRALLDEVPRRAQRRRRRDRVRRRRRPRRTDRLPPERGRRGAGRRSTATSSTAVAARCICGWNGTRPTLPPSPRC